MFRNHPTLERVFINGSNLSDKIVLKLIEEIPNLEFFDVGWKKPNLQALLNSTFLAKRNARD